MTLKPTPFQVATGVIVITHLVGIFGFFSPLRETFETITPLHLLLSAGILLYFHSSHERNFWIAAGFLALAGYGVEVAGTNTGVIFGEYTYDETLGPKFFATPPVIGINWMMLVIAFGSLLSGLNVPNLIRAMLGALCMVGMDYLIEPIAIEFGFWHWERTTVPTHNYLGWLVTAFILFLAYFEAPFPKKNKIALTLLIMQFIFFGSINLFL